MQVDSQLLPLGSVVRASGAKCLVIVARGLMLTVDGQSAYFDYGACVYPEGMIGDSMLYFNVEDVVEVVHEGFTDDEDRVYVESIGQIARTVTLSKGDTRQFRENAMRAYERGVVVDG